MSLKRNLRCVGYKNVFVEKGDRGVLGRRKMVIVCETVRADVRIP